VNAPEALLLPDIQSIADHRNLAIDQVGVKGIRHPVQIRTAGGGLQPSVASISMYVGLPSNAKGTHMSRFLEVLQSHRRALDYTSLRELTGSMCLRLDATRGLVDIALPYFVTKTAPVSGATSLLDCDVRWRGKLDDTGFACALSITAPVTSLWPCSKEISAYGGHNQRSHITLSAELAAPMEIEELIRVAEQEASCEVFGLLKRSDKKRVTGRTHDNPRFLEDLVRDIALRLDGDTRIAAYVVESEHFESIHDHSAYARLARSAGSRRRA